MLTATWVSGNRYLIKRVIANSSRLASLAMFIPLYAEYKEQKVTNPAACTFSHLAHLALPSFLIGVRLVAWQRQELYRRLGW